MLDPADILADRQPFLRGFAVEGLVVGLTGEAGSASRVEATLAIA
jgi:hypothetical protein